MVFGILKGLKIVAIYCFFLTSVYEFGSPVVLYLDFGFRDWVFMTLVVRFEENIRNPCLTSRNRKKTIIAWAWLSITQPILAHQPLFRLKYVKNSQIGYFLVATKMLVCLFVSILWFDRNRWNGNTHHHRGSLENTLNMQMNHHHELLRKWINSNLILFL